jgi:hypothetical protein
MKKVGSLIRTRTGPGILLLEVTFTMPMTPPAAVPDLATRLLVIPFAALGTEASAPLPVSSGLPSGAFEVASANMILAATMCDEPMFSQTIERVAHARKRDVVLVRTGFHPETLNAVRVDVALHAANDVLTLTGLSFYRDVDLELWLVPEGVGPSLAFEPRGLRLEIEPPYLTWGERGDGLVRAATEIVRLSTRGRVR